MIYHKKKKFQSFKLQTGIKRRFSQWPLKTDSTFVLPVDGGINQRFRVSGMVETVTFSAVWNPKENVTQTGVKLFFE